MQETSIHHPLPRAGIDPINDAATALNTVEFVLHRPPRVETIVVLLDHERRGVAVAVVTNTVDLDDVLGVVECLAASSAHGGRVGAMIVASVRSASDDSPDTDTVNADSDGLDDPDSNDADSNVVDLNDIDRWLEMSELTDQAGVDLLEWFVIGASVSCPRDQLGEPPRW